MERFGHLLLGLYIATMAAASHSDSLTLEQLFAGGQLTSGDKVFSEWLWFSDGDFATTDVNPADIIVTTIDDPINPGLEFDVSAGMRSVNGIGDDIYLDFGYTVKVMDPAMRIKATSSELTDYSILNATDPLGTIDILSFVLDENFNDIGLTNTFADQYLDTNGQLISDLQLSDSTPLPQKSLIYVDHLIDLFGDSAVSKLNKFEQRFMQTEASVPEPATWMIFLVGLAFLTLRHRGRLLAVRA